MLGFNTWERLFHGQVMQQKYKGPTQWVCILHFHGEWQAISSDTTAAFSRTHTVPVSGRELLPLRTPYAVTLRIGL